MRVVATVQSYTSYKYVSFSIMLRRVGARKANMERYSVAKLCRDDLESSGGGDGVEI